jgi:dihydropteroate synthase
LSPSEFNNWLLDVGRRPLVMGVLNVTPDSFSDGGRFLDPTRAAEAACAMLDAGADLIDVGGESTRPGAMPVAADEQIHRVVPVIEGIRKRSSATISVDTTQSAVALAALDAGANLINDTSAGRDDAGMLLLAANRSAAIVLMHRQGVPPIMQREPVYSDVTREVAEFLRHRLEAALAAGVKKECILLDPGIGFGKNVEHNLTLLRDLSTLAAIGRPVVVGTSRKSFIGRILGEEDPHRRSWGDAAAISWAVTNGAAMLRVHEVRPMAQVVRMTRAIQRGAAG